MNAPKLQFLVSVLEKHPKPVFAMKNERAAAEELARLGVLEELLDKDKERTGDFKLTPPGEILVQALEKTVTDWSRGK